MVNLETLFSELSKRGVRFFTGVPDSLLNDFCTYALTRSGESRHILAANEGNAIGIAAGHYLATGEIPLVYMQNSGLGNAMNPLLSLSHEFVYSIPMILVVGWRGEPSGNDHAQHRKQGALTPVLMDDMDIPYEIADNDDSCVEKFCRAIDKAREISSPVALIAKKGILSRAKKEQTYPVSSLMSREEAISEVIDRVGAEAVYLATTGRATRELHEQLSRKGFPAGREFLNVGSMGHLSSVGLGIALAAKGRKVVVFDGDAALLMHLGSLATVGRYKPENLLHVILNNGANESVGGQVSAGQIADLTAMARAAGYVTAGSFATTPAQIEAALAELSALGGPEFLDIRIRQGIREDLPKLEVDCKELKETLMTFLTAHEN